jgi:2-polyprenyl-3-methyl-5-hydroxy-6-metoxy-1,4-benzoquinol methylase
MSTPHYVIRGGSAGRERLRVLARVMSPTTNELLARVGVGLSARCLDIGCGGGDVTVALARLADEGSVVGIDLDETKIELARAEAADAGITNVDFRLHDVTEPLPFPEDDRFDLVYARFVLTHLPDPAQALANIRERLAPGGVLVAEDIDCAGHFCAPPSPPSTATSGSTSTSLGVEAAIPTSDHACPHCCARRAWSGSASTSCSRPVSPVTSS